MMMISMILTLYSFDLRRFKTEFSYLWWQKSSASSGANFRTLQLAGLKRLSNYIDILVWKLRNYARRMHDHQISNSCLVSRALIVFRLEFPNCW